MRKHLLLLAAKFKENEKRIFKDLESVKKSDHRWLIYYTWQAARREVEDQLVEFDNETS